MTIEVRYPVLIHLGDYRDAPIPMKRDVAAAAQRLDCIEAIDDEENHAKWILFRTRYQAEKMIEAARAIGFTTAGRKEPPLYIQRR